MIKKLILAGSLIAILAVPTVSNAALVDDLRAHIQSLLQTVSSLQQQLTTLEGATGTSIAPFVTTPAGTSASCPALYRNLWLGTSGSDVASLQTYLQSVGVYTHPVITGYYGVVTQRAVQVWQQQQGIAYSGGAGFGQAGPRTRAAIQKACGTVVPVPPTDPTTPPRSCRVWNDGCNTCTRSYEGGPLACTLRACFAAGTPRCEEYFPATTQAPTIHSFSGPTTLQRNETGTWSIDASDPYNETLVYHIDWGESRGWFVDALAALPASQFVQRTTFTHEYANEGVYTVTITVRNAARGKETQTTMAVRVVDTILSTDDLTASPTTGVAPLPVLFRANVGGYTPYAYYVDYGDGSARQQVDCYAPADYCLAPATVSHVYTQAGTYTARLIKEVRASGTRGNTISSVRVVVTPFVSGSVCWSSGHSYTEGSTLFCINPSDGPREQCVADARYVCRSGSWQVESTTRPTICTLEYVPVCGRAVGGGLQTYGNACQMNASGATYISAGECPLSGAHSIQVTVAPRTGGYRVGDDIPVSWNAHTLRTDVGMYVVLEDTRTGDAIKSVKVPYQNGTLRLTTGSMCNNFFSDGLDSSCASLRNAIAKGSTQYRIRAALYSPASTCFGFCGPSSNSAQVEILADDFSDTFIIQ